MSWSIWKPTADEPWDFASVAHLHRRAGFTPDWATIQRGIEQGVERAVDECLKCNVSSNSSDVASFEQLSTTISEAAVGAGSADRIRAWWAWRMLMTPQPLCERMTLLWHNHFATSNDKVQDVAAMLEQNQIFRKHALGRFGDLLSAVVKHRAMLVWLDANIRSRVTSPVEFVIGTARALEFAQSPPSSWLLASEMRGMGQDLFHPPNVFGWPGGRAWIHTRSLVHRQRFAEKLIRGQLHQSQASVCDVRMLAQRHSNSTSVDSVIRFYAELLGNGLQPFDPERRFGEQVVADPKVGDSLSDIVIRILAAPENQLC